MNNQDEIKVNGKLYKAVDAPWDGCCTCDLPEECFNPKVLCMPMEREDRRDVIFVEKQ